MKRSLTLAELTYGENITAMAPAPNGNFWVGGYTCSNALPTTSNAIQKTWSGQPCVSIGFLERLLSDGRVDYLSYWGGSGSATITALATDATWNLYIGGSTTSADFATTAGAFARTCAGACTKPDGFVTKVSPDGGTVLFSTYLGGADNDTVRSIAVDSNGGVHVAGSTSSQDFPVTPDAFQRTWQPGFDRNQSPLADAFYTRLAADGSALQYSTYIGGSGLDQANGIAADASGNAYVVGLTGNPSQGGQDFPLLSPAQSQRSSGGFGAYAFLAKFGASGAVYSTFMGGTGDNFANAIAAAGTFVYISGREDASDFPHVLDSAAGGNAYIAEVADATGAVTRSIALHGTIGTVAQGQALAVDQNQVAYLTGFFVGNDCQSCGLEANRYPATWDAFRGDQASIGDRDAILSIVDFRPATPEVLYSTKLGGTQTDEASGVIPDAAGGAFVAGRTEKNGFPSVNPQPSPPPDPSGNNFQPFVVHVGARAFTTPPAPDDTVLYAYDQDGFNPTAIAGNWKIDQSATGAAGGAAVHEADSGAPKITAPAANPVNYFDLEFLAEANVPYHVWLRMKADSDSFQNDSVWVQFSDSVDGGGTPVWRIHSTDGTAVSLEDCSGCGEQGWGWNDNGYGVAGTPVLFATSGWHTIRIQQREDGVSIDQIVLSSGQWANTAPGANKNDATVLPETNEFSSNQAPTVSISTPSNGATFTPGSDITIGASASDSDGTVSKVDFFANGTLVGTSTAVPYSAVMHNPAPGTYTLTATATDDRGAQTTSSPVTVTMTGGTSSGLPSGWTDADVGRTGATGSANDASGTFTVQGAGADVWGTADAFNYAYTPLLNDGWIVARVATVSDEANWVKAGVMIRGSLDPSSWQAFMLVSHSKGLAFQRRTADGAASVSTSGSASGAPRWVKLVRTFDTISAYESADGAAWNLVGSDTFPTTSVAYIGLAVSSHVSGTLATATFDSVETSVPPPWTDGDIGSVPVKGSAEYSDGTFSVTGSGVDIWGTSDAFHYVFQNLEGDGTIVARVATIQNVDPWVKAGVMIRDTFNAGSPHAFMLVSASKGVAFQRRDGFGQTSVSTAGSASAAPHWVKLTRSGNTFSGYESADGVNWTLVGTDVIAMGTGVDIGFVVTSHNTSAAATCTFDHVSIQ